MSTYFGVKPTPGINQNSQNQTISPTTPPPTSPLPTTTKELITAELPQFLGEFETKDFIITYSLKGGYIKNIILKKHKQLLPFTNIGWQQDDKDTQYQVNTRDNQLIFSSLTGQKKFSFTDYLLKLELSPGITQPILICDNIPSKDSVDQRYQEYFSWQNQIIQRDHIGKIKNTILNNVETAGFRDRYYCCVLLKNKYTIQWNIEKNNGFLYVINPVSSIELYIGTEEEQLLQPFGLQGVINYGFFHVIGVILVKILSIMFQLTKNWGISLIGLAILMYLILFPGMHISTKAMKKMQSVQPMMDELKKKYPNDPQKLNQAVLELYKTHKINPLGGCLPLLLQFPIFIALYQVLMRFGNLKGAQFLWIKDLSLPDQAFKLFFTIPFLGNYINILPILMIVIGLVQQKVVGSPAASTKDQKNMMLFMSVFMGIIFYNFPACLSLYWVVQNILTFIYQYRTNPKKEVLV
jgi:YidC/Oxa1 family membrane protein insertase